MWIFLSDSFVSIVVDREKPDNLLVRGRKKGDVERFMRPVQRVKATFSPSRDYAYRASVLRKKVEEAVANAAGDIDYFNFKDSVKDDKRHDAYLSVWTRMFEWGASQVRGRRRAWTSGLRDPAGLDVVEREWDAPLLDAAARFEERD